MPKKKRRGSKMAGKYVGLLNAMTGPNKSKAKRIRKSRGLSAAVKFMGKHRKKSKGRRKARR
jgi:hypothetical protein